MKYHEIKSIGGRLRKNPTKSEVLMWEHLRKRKLGGYRFLRQHPIYYEHNNNEHFFYIPDFYCAELRLIIELDGDIHLQQKEKNGHRDDILKERGFKILRIRNEQLTEIDTLKAGILSFIETNCKSPKI